MREKNILVVDDDPIRLNLTVEMLLSDPEISENFKIIFHDQPEKTWQSMLQGEILPCLVITDFRMPLMNGAQLTNLIKENFLIPVIIFSSDEPSQVPENRADLFLPKIISLSDFLNSVKKTLSQY